MKRISIALFLLLSLLVSAADYYVSPAGADRNPGSRKLPFATFAKALSVLKAGDTLYMAPGDYAGAGCRNLVGTREKPIVIRAEIPGTVVIRGDREVRGFKPVPGFRFVYELPWREPVGGVKERDTLNYYFPVSALELLKNNRSAWFHDVKKGKLYVATGDGEAPDNHRMTVCTGNPLEGHGLQLLNKSRYVHIDGLNFTGFDSYVIKWGKNFYSVKSLHLNNCSNIKVTNCRFFLNGCGLTFWNGKDSLVENCAAYANYSLAVGSAANIYFTKKAANCVVRNCTTFKSDLSGIRFYSGPFPNCVIERCVAWGHGMSDLEIKAPDSSAVIRESIGVRNAVNTTVRNTITGGNSYRLTPADDPSSLYWRQKGVAEMLNSNLADYENWDGRPMSDSKLKGGLSFDKSVYFISPGGNDSNSGNTIRAPRKSLKNIPDGATVYLMPGKYGKLVVSQKNITLAGRGRYTKALVAGLEVKGSDVTVRKINFSKDVTGSGKNVKFENCSFAGDLYFKNAGNFRVTHCAFVKGKVVCSNSTGAVFSNIMAQAVSGAAGVYVGNNAYPERIPAGEKRSIVCKALFKAPDKGDFTLKNALAFAGYALDALPIGPYNRLPGIPGKGIMDAAVFRTTPESAEIRWYLPNGRENCSVEWWCAGEKARSKSVFGETSRTVTITGLKPGTAYSCRIRSSHAAVERFLNIELTSAEKKQFRTGANVTLKFTTPAVKNAPREYFVSVKGSDKAPGTKAAPFRTISRALDAAAPGDTVTVREGSYCENLELKVSDFTLRGMEGEKVWLDGERKLLNFISFYNKRNITIDNLRMKALITTKKSYIRASNSSNIKLSRIFFDGRWADGYTPTPLYFTFCDKVLMENCVTMNAFRGLHFVQCNDVHVRNCVLSMNSLNQLHFNSFLENYKAVIENNIICDMIPSKLRNALIHAEHTHPGLKIENNCFYTRTGAAARNFVGTWYGKGSGFHPIAHYRKAHPGKETNVFKDPGFSGLKLHSPPFAEGLSKKEYQATPDGKSWKVLDYKDFFPADQELRRRGIGLREKEVR